MYRDKRSHLTRAHIFLSLAYTASIVWPGQLNNDVYNHHFILSYDTTTKKFHTFSHTYSPVSLSLDEGAVSSDMLSVCSPFQPFPFVRVYRTTTAPLVTNLKLLTYNVWNTNQLENESYDDRLKRMKKVHL